MIEIIHEAVLYSSIWAELTIPEWSTIKDGQLTVADNGLSKLMFLRTLFYKKGLAGEKNKETSSLVLFSHF